MSCMDIYSVCLARILIRYVLYGYLFSSLGRDTDSVYAQACAFCPWTPPMSAKSNAPAGRELAWKLLQLVATDKRLTLRQVRVLIFLVSRANFETVTRFSYDAIAEGASLAPPHVGPALKALAKNGYVRRTVGAQTPFGYRLKFPAGHRSS